MAGNFNSSSFIPKGGSQYSESSPSKSSGSDQFGILLAVSSVLFLLAAAAAGGVFFYTQSLETDLAEKKTEFKQAQGVFQPDVVNRLTTIDKRTSAAKKLLNNHRAVTPVFDVIESVTLASVQLNSVTISTSPSDNSSDGNQGGEGGGEGADVTPTSLGEEDAETALDVETAGTSSAAESPGEQTSSANDSPGKTVPISMSGTAPSYPAVALQVEALEDGEDIRNPQLSDFSSGDRGQVKFSVKFSIPADYVSYKESLE